MRQMQNLSPPAPESATPANIASLFIEVLVSTVGGCASTGTTLEAYLDRLERAS